MHTGQTSYTAKDQVDYQSLGGTTGGFLQQVDFTYLSNGFLEKINDPSGLGSDLFALGIGYDQAAANSNGVAQYNGNIASLESVSASGTHHVYGYEYDGLNRLKEADFYDNNDSGANDRYNSSYTYDALGNIQTLSRAGAKYDGQSVSYGTIDDLSYTYDASNNRNNRLLSVADNAPSGTKSAGYDPKSSSNFTYDDSGNMTYSPTGDYGIAYNFLNLPYEFDLIEDKILNTYAADETKLQELRVNDSGDTLMKRDYLGPAVYTNDSLTFVSHSNARIVPGECDLALNLSHTGQFSGQETYKAVTIQSTATMLDNSNISYKGESRISLGEGFMVESDAVFSAEVTPCPPVGSWVYQYYISDHLGNNRILFADLDGDGSVNTNEVLQENHYYAFGMEMEGDWQGTTSVPDQRYRYNGKELNEELGLYDYGARWYDPAIGRWNAVDPKADLQESITPYAYCLNSPILYIDPDGSLPILINGRTGADSQRANDSYWAQNLLNTIANSGIPNPGGQIHYTDGNVGLNYKMNSRGKKIGDPFVSNAAMTASQRTGAGRVVAGQEFESILAKLERDPESGLITEKIQIYSHSRGGAFAQGFTERLLELIEQNSDEFADPNSVIDFGLHLAPHQSNEITGAAGVNNYSISHTLDGLSGNDMANSVNFHTNVGNLKSAHTNTTFGNEVGMFLQSIQANGGDRDGTVRDFFQRVQAAGINITIQ